MSDLSIETFELRIEVRPNCDYTFLIENYTSLKQFIKVTRKGLILDYKDKEAIREFTYAILWANFKLRIEIPLNSLCPTIPNRLTYLYWIQEVLLEKEYAKNNAIDIGTGSSCIYPLLYIKSNLNNLKISDSLRKNLETNSSKEKKIKKLEKKLKNFKFFCFETDKRNFEFSKQNVELNKLNLHILNFFFENKKDKVKILRRKCLMGFKFDFLCCNPPFYESQEEILSSRTLKKNEPNAICMGVETEMITTGGEFEFILKLFEESLKFKSNIRWFTSLIGKRENFFCLQNILKNENEIKLLKFSNFKIGKTVRYMIAWSFLLKSEKLVPVKKKDLNPFLKNDLNTENESNTPLQKVKKQKLK